MTKSAKNSGHYPDRWRSGENSVALHSRAFSSQRRQFFPCRHHWYQAVVALTSFQWFLAFVIQFAAVGQTFMISKACDASDFPASLSDL